MWLPAENSSVALAAHFRADEKSLHSETEISQRQSGPRVPWKEAQTWKGTAGCFKVSPSPGTNVAALRELLSKYVKEHHSGGRTIN